MKQTIAVLDKKGGNTTLSAQDNQCCLRFEETTTIIFDGIVYLPIPDSSGAKIIAQRLQKVDRFKASETFLKEVEGDFAFMIVGPERIIAGRDPVGVQPLYYGETKNIVALASNRRALWKLGVEEARSFPPGHLALITREGFKFKPVKTLVYQEPKQVGMKDAAETLQKLLEKAVYSRISGAKDVAVAFSGGLDSSVVAFLAKKCEANVNLVHVSLEDQPETEDAKKAADALNLPLHIYLFKEKDVEQVVPKVVELIEEADPINASIGVPFYWAAEKTAELGFRVMLAGQGADELFGGYQRYVNEYTLREGEAVRKTMFDDVVRIHENNLERDVKICSFHNVDLRVPFGSFQIAEFAMALPLELKIERHADTLRKLVLRKAAENMGMPTSVTNKPKKAVQYSTGINNSLKKIAKKQKATLAEYVKNLLLNQAKQN
ncbi:asparagine synthetase B [Candidatus Bathyarchaeota archaeon]|nr:asparagine synthetase B [Candidatus Bathyarchaeota archaeon]